MPSKTADKKLRVYEVAKDLGMSSEAVLQIVKRLGVEVKNHMSTLLPETVARVQAEMAQERPAVRVEMTRKHEQEVQRAREERARAAAAAAAAAAPAAPHAPPGPGATRPGTRPPLGRGLERGAPGASAHAPPGARPGGPGMRRRDRKKKKVVDEKLVLESVRKTLASLDTGGARRRHHRREDENGEVATEDLKVIRAHEFITVAELANLMEVKPQEVIATCMRLGLMATINKRLDKDSIVTVADEFGFDVEFVSEYGEEESAATVVETEEQLLPRAPVVTVMGHVDHGKTSLLDYIRKTNVIAGEAGGITQHIGAYEVVLPGDKKICFLDTPGHEAFTAMRARGAQVTDIVVLVVAADDRVMPQTIEAIDHAKAASVPIVVAINKIDLPTAKPDLVKQELAQHGVVVEEYGGKSVCVEISAKKGTNIDRLLEMILLVAELLDLKANPDKHARGVVLEARVEQGRGIVASLLVQGGTLRVGDAFVAGQHYGRVRAMFDERQRQLRLAGPSTPAEVLGWNGTPAAGDTFAAFDDEREAREIANKRQALHREHEFRAAKAISLADFHTRMSQGELTELKMVLKGRRRRLGRGAVRVAHQARHRRGGGAHHPPGGGTDLGVRRAAGRGLGRDHRRLPRAPRSAGARAGGAREGRDPLLRHHLQGGRGREAGARGAAQARAQGGGARHRRGAPAVQALQGRLGLRLHGDLGDDPARRQGAADARRRAGAYRVRASSSIA